MNYSTLFIYFCLVELCEWNSILRFFNSWINNIIEKVQ